MGASTENAAAQEAHGNCSRGFAGSAAWQTAAYASKTRMRRAEWLLEIQRRVCGFEAWQTATLNASKKLPRPEWLVRAAGDGLMILMPGKLAFPQTATLNASKKRMPRPECLKENSRASFKASQTAALNASANGRPRPECLVGAAAEGNRQP